MLKLVDAVGIAPDVIEPIDDDEQPPPFRGQGIGYPCQVLPKVCGLARYDARHVRCLGRYLVEERIGDVEEGGAIRRGFAKRQEIVMADHQSVRGEDLGEVAEIGALAAARRSPEHRDGHEMLDDTAEEVAVERDRKSTRLNSSH